MSSIAPPTSRWLWANTLAIGFSLAHLMLDWHLGIFGAATPRLSTAQAAILIVGAGVYALWANMLAQANRASRRAMIAVIGLCVIGGLGNGISIAACFPPCEGAFPFGDMAHIGSLVFGAWAIIESWRILNRK